MRTSNFDKIKKYFSGSKKPLIQEIVREPTAGGVIFRRNKKGEAEFLLYWQTFIKKDRMAVF